MRPVLKLLAGTTRALRILVALLSILLCHASMAQNAATPAQPLPTYLSSNPPNSKSGDLAVVTAKMLNKPYPFSLRQIFYNTAELRYAVPDGFGSFSAMVGMDDTYANVDQEVTFEVIGIDANGHPNTLATDMVKALRMPKEVRVSLQGINTLILRATTAPGIYCNLSWGSARFEPGGGGGGNGQKVQIILDDGAFKAQLNDLAQQLEKADTPEVQAGKKAPVSIPQCVFLAQSGQTPDEKTLADIQGGLNAQLGKIKTFDVTPFKESFSDDLKDFVMGSDLDDKTRVAVSKRIDDPYILLGSIADRDTKLVIRTCLYDLRSGKPIAEAKVSVPIKERHILGAVPPKPDKITISLLFAPAPNLRVNDFEWSIDGDAIGNKRLANGPANVARLVDPGKHKFTLTWNGAGYREQGAPKDDYQQVIVDEFEIDITKPVNVELTARVNVFPRKLLINVRSGDTRLTPSWH